MNEMYPLVLPLTVSIEYRIGDAVLESGTFDNIPDDAYGAKVTCHSPVVNSDGNIVNHSFEYDLYVGEKRNTDTLNDEEYAYLKQDLIQRSVKEVVITKYGPIALNHEDRVFETKEKMAEVIGKISRACKQVQIIRAVDEQSYEENERRRSK